MKRCHVLCLCITILIALQGCATIEKTQPFEIDSSEQQALYDLMLERCAAINARDVARLKKVYADGSTEYGWLKDRWLPEYERWRITHRVIEVKKISIVDTDGAGQFVLKLDGQLSRSRYPTPTVDVLFTRQADGWKILKVSER